MYERFLRVAEELGDRVAVTSETEQASFAQLSEWVDCLASLLGQGDEPLMILLKLPGGPHFTAVQLAGVATNSIVVPISPQSKERELSAYLDLIHPDLVVAEDLGSVTALLQILREPTTILLRNGSHGSGRLEHRVLEWAHMGSGKLVDRADSSRDLPGDTFLLEFTSGSTGKPKGVLLGLSNLESYLTHNDRFLKRFAGEDVFCPMPQFHAFCGTVVLEHLLSGASVHVANTYMPGEHIQRLVKFSCSAILSAPTYVRLLLEMSSIDSRALPTLRSISLGSAAIDQVLVARLHGRFENLEICLRYGLTETMGPICRICLSPGEELEAPGLVGALLPGVELAGGLPTPGAAKPEEVRIRSEIVAQGQLLHRGVWEPLLDSDGFFPTGDLGYLDSKGRLHLRGRISTFIKRNGFRIDPFEIEAVLSSQAGVGEAVVLGLADSLSGERVVAYIECTGSEGSTDREALIRACREQLSAAKIPQEIRFVDRLPRTPSGKPDRVLLKHSLAEGDG